MQSRQHTGHPPQAPQAGRHSPPRQELPQLTSQICTQNKTVYVRTLICVWLWVFRFAKWVSARSKCRTFAKRFKALNFNSVTPGIGEINTWTHSHAFFIFLIYFICFYSFYNNPFSTSMMRDNGVTKLWCSADHLGLGFPVVMTPQSISRSTA